MSYTPLDHATYEKLKALAASYGDNRFADLADEYAPRRPGRPAGATKYAHQDDRALDELADMLFNERVGSAFEGCRLLEQRGVITAENASEGAAAQRLYQKWSKEERQRWARAVKRHDEALRGIARKANQPLDRINRIVGQLNHPITAPARMLRHFF